MWGELQIIEMLPLRRDMDAQDEGLAFRCLVCSLPRGRVIAKEAHPCNRERTRAIGVNINVETAV